MSSHIGRYNLHIRTHFHVERTYLLYQFSFGERRPSYSIRSFWVDKTKFGQRGPSYSINSLMDIQDLVVLTGCFWIERTQISDLLDQFIFGQRGPSYPICHVELDRAQLFDRFTLGRYYQDTPSFFLGQTEQIYSISLVLGLEALVI